MRTALAKCGREEACSEAASVVSNAAALYYILFAAQHVSSTSLSSSFRYSSSLSSHYRHLGRQSFVVPS